MDVLDLINYRQPPGEKRIRRYDILLDERDVDALREIAPGISISLFLRQVMQRALAEIKANTNNNKEMKEKDGKA